MFSGGDSERPCARQDDCHGAAPEVVCAIQRAVHHHRLRRLAAQEHRRSRSHELGPNANAPRRVEVGCARITVLNRSDALAAVTDLVLRAAHATHAVTVVTPNIQHIALLEEVAEFRDAYENASLVLADGWPVALAASLIDRRRVPVVTGSDLVPALLASPALVGRRIALVGGTPGTARALEAAVRKLGASARVWQPNLDVDDRSAAELLRFLTEHKPDLTVFGLGAPKQELLAEAVRPHLQSGVLLGAGTTLDYLSGHRRRAPKLMVSLKLEWLYRLWIDPKRLGGRYLHAAPGFTRAVFRTLMRSRQRT